MKKQNKTIIIDPQKYYDSLIFQEENPKLTYALDFIDLLLEIAIDIQNQEMRKEKLA